MQAEYLSVAIALPAMDLATTGARLEAAIERAGTTARALSAALGIKEQNVSQWVAGVRSGRKHMPQVAEILGVSHDWLMFGDADKAPSWARPAKPEPKTLGQGLSVYGVVAKASPLEDDTKGAPIDRGATREVKIPSSWVLVEVRGMSAYPILFPGQMGIFDTDRAASPTFSPEQMTDLHDNVVLVSLNTGRAYLKRFCHAEKAPHGYVLASVDAGRSSPYVPPDEISVIMPMVGTLYQDPSKPRQKRWHGKTVIVETPEL